MAKELLTDIVIRSTKPIAAKDIRLSDGNGLYLLTKVSEFISSSNKVAEH